MAGNTGYVSYANLELYYPDDNSAAGETKANVFGTVGYIAPVYNTGACPPSVRFYNVQLTASATKNNCGGGQVGSSVVMTATANSFVSQISQADANAQANNYLTSNVQAYANNLGTCTVTADTTPPNNVTNVTTSNITSTSVDVTFNCSTDNVGIAGYRIFVNNSPNPFVDFATSQSSGSLTLTVGNLVPNGGYYFNVVAYDAAGNTNAGTVSGIVYTLSNAPATPAGLNVTTFSSSELYITWSGSAGATGYTLYRSNSLNGIYDFLVDTGTATDWFDTNLIENTVYFYKVQAYNASAFSAFSAAVSGQTSQGGDVIAPV